MMITNSVKERDPTEENDEKRVILMVEDVRDKIKQELGFVYADPKVSPICTYKNLQKVLAVVDEYICIKKEKLEDFEIHCDNCGKPLTLADIFLPCPECSHVVWSEDKDES